MQPSADQASEMHCGTTSFELLPAVTISGFNSVTPSLPSRSQILIVEPVATHSQYLVEEKGCRWLVVVNGTGELERIRFEFTESDPQKAVRFALSYLFGEKHRALITSLWSSVYRCLPSFRSHSIALASLPPDAHSEPSGETVTQFR